MTTEVQTAVRFVAVLEAFQERILKATAQSEPITDAYRNEAVECAEAAMKYRSQCWIGDDPVVASVNAMPERHHQVAYKLSRALAEYDGVDHANPFNCEVLQRIYTNEHAFMRYLAQRTQRDLTTPPCDA